jgi:uncharacterized repeat protein (TIGR01451 family)
LVTNTGNVTLTNVQVTDPMPGLSPVTCPRSTLVFPAESEICTATHTTTQADVDRGSITNTGTAHGTPPTGPDVTHESTATVPATTSPAITFVKSANPLTFSAAGAPITYSYVVTNTGNVTLNPVVVTDPLPGLSAVSCPGSSLAPGTAETCTATYSTTQADLDAGKVVNTAHVDATPPSGPVLTRQSSATVFGSQLPSIGLVKTASIGVFTDLGTPITYTYTVRNNGNVTLTSINVTDPMPGLSAITCPSSTLLPGATEACTATYTTTQADLDRGFILNTGTAFGTPPTGPELSSSASRSIPALQTPSIGVVKQASIANFTAPGIPVTYTYVVTNTGNVTLTSVNVADPLPGVSTVNCPTPTLTPGQSESCTATYTTTQADVNRGGVTNTATASGTPPTGPPVTGQSTVTIPSTRTPAITIDKSADVESFSLPGTLITYSYLVTNTGNVTLTSVGVTDPLPGLSSVTCPSGTLAPGASETCTAGYRTTQADINAGGVTNTGTASGTPPTGSPVTAADTVTVPASQTPAIALNKTANTNTFSTPGTVVTYSYLVTNNGNVTLTSVHVDDPRPGLSAIDCKGVSTLAPGASVVCTATYAITQADVDRGSVTNIGTATGTTPTGSDVTDRSTVTISADQNPGITVLKSANVTNFTGAGVPVIYSYLVTNTGNVTLNPVVVTDPLPGLSIIACPNASLAPGAAETCTATYTTTQADVDRGSVTNVGTASGVSPSGAPPVTDDSTVTIPAVQAPAIDLVKSATVSSFTKAGTPVTYQYLVTNTGNVTLTSIKVADPMPGLSAVTCTVPVLAPGESETCTASYTTTQADVDRGSINNTGTATGTPPTGPAVSDQSPLSIPAVQSPAITVVKSANIADFEAPDTPVTYSYLVTNTGNVTLTSITVTDPLPGLSTVVCPNASLLPGGSEICTATYSTTQADLDAGNVTNTGTAHGTPPRGPPVTAVSTVIVPAVQTPGINLVKTSDAQSFSGAGTTITYSYKVTNTGNVTLNPVVVTDPMAGLSTIDCPDTSLAPAAVQTCTASYVTLQSDVDNGNITNTGTATGTPPTGSDVTSASTEVINAVQQPAIGLKKTANVLNFSAPGTVITYSYAVTNVGNTTLTSIVVTDPMPGLSAITCPDTTLAPGASTICTATYTTTQADVDRGSIHNTGTVTASGPLGQTVIAKASATVPGFQTPDITLSKSSNPSIFSAPGTTITYSYLVTNTGTVTLNPVVVSDPMPGLSAIDCPVASLAPNGQETCTATYITNQADVDRGSISNTGTATGTPPTGPKVSDQSPLTVLADPTPALTVAKSAAPTTVTAAGQVVTYTFLVTNTGNVTLSAVTVDETAFSGTGPPPVAVCPADPLAPGASLDCNATYTVTQADIDAGSIANTATATATPPPGDTAPVSPPSSATVDAPASPALTVAKSAAPTTVTAAGQVVTYTFHVTNTGNVTVSAVTIDETAFSGTGPPPVATCPAGPLAPAASVDCSATYTVTQPDIDAGSIANTATATATPPPGDTAPVSPPSSATVDATAAPALTVLKSASPGTVSAPGDVVTYTFHVTNTGNLTLNTLTIDESAFTGSGPTPVATCPPGPLAPAASVDCSATYTVTQADIDAGTIANTAVATGTTPDGGAVDSPPSLATVPATQTPALTVAKSASPGTVGAPGDVVTYTFHVTNTGNVTLTAVAIAESSFSGTGAPPVATCPPGPLAPAASVDCSATYTVTQADIDAGSIANTAVAAASPPDGGTVDSPPSSATVDVTQTPALTLTKSASPGTVASAGQVVTYTFHVINTGNVTLTTVAIDETVFSGTGGVPVATCPAGPLAPAASVDCSATYTVTQADIDAGSIANTAVAAASPPSGGTVDSPPSSATVNAPATPGLTVAKSASPGTVNAAGDVVTYTFHVTNTGNVTLTAVAIDETVFSGTGGVPVATCPAGPLAPDASVDCSATYTVTQADIDAGSIDNTATATATPPPGDTAPVSPPSSVTVDAPAAPALTVAKSASPGTVNAAGDVVTYTFHVINTGNVTLTAVVIDESVFSGTGGVPVATCPAGSLAPAASVDCSATYTVTQADIDAGSIANTATATATPPPGDTAPVSPPSSATVDAPAAPALTVAKSASPGTVTAAGQTVTYTFHVVNTGNVTLSAVTIDETVFSGTGGVPVATCPAGPLAPAASVDCSASYTVTQADIDAASIANTAVAAASPPSGGTVDSPPSSATVDAPAAPALTVAKSANPGTVTAAGQVVTYTFHVINTGNVTLSAVTIDETVFSGTGARPVATCPAGPLAPAASVDCSATYTVTQADIDAGSIANTATATATPPPGDTAPVSPPSSATVQAPAAPALTVVKSAAPGTYDHVGQVVTYTYTLTNSGNVTLDGPFTVTDDRAAVTCPATATLAPAAMVTCTATYTVTQADLDGGSVTNHATGSAVFDGNPVTSNQATATVTADQKPALSLDKSVTPAIYRAVGDVLSYSYVVTNTGNVTLTDPVTVTDDRATVTCPGTLLAPDQSLTCTATYTVTQADLDAGAVTNTASATSGTTTSPVDTASALAAQTPELGLAKSAAPGTYDHVGQSVSYTYTLTNTGNVTLGGPFAVADDRATVTCPTTATLAPVAVVTCTATHTVTQADLDAGSLTNHATASAVFDGNPVSSNQATATVTAVATPALAVMKSASPTTVDHAGEDEMYTFHVTNTGNVTLTAVAIDETTFSGTGAKPTASCPPGSLAPGHSVDCIATYTVTQADIDAGSIANTAVAAATIPGGGEVDSLPSSVTVDAPAHAALTVVKTASPTTVTEAGQVVTYSFEVTNTGNVTETGVKITDTMPGLSPISCPSTTLAPAASMTCTATYTATQADIAHGSIMNVATASGIEPDGDPMVSVEATAIVNAAAPVAPQSPITPVTVAVTG